MRRRRWVFITSLVVLATTLGIVLSRRVATVEIEVRIPDGLDGRSVRIRGADVRSRRADGSRVVFVLSRPAAEVVAYADGACPRSILMPIREEHLAITLDPVFDLGRPLAQVGFDAPFEIAVREGCAETRAGVIEWRQIAGPPLARLEPDPGGFVVRGRTRSWSAAPREAPWGIVPMSPATRDTALLEASWRPSRSRAAAEHGDANGGPAAAAALRTTIEVSAAARATGIPTIAEGQALLLAGEGFRIVKTTPAVAPARLDNVATGIVRFLPEASAHYLLADAAGRSLAIRAGRHDTTSLDCGRSECHAATTANAQTSAMTHVLHRGLDGAFGPDYRPACALACHAVGEPGLDDGGFLSTMMESRASPLSPPGKGAWDALPRALRRLGGVGCTACHGPATIPEPSSRWTILRADVCATCHDAPPRYALVGAWRASRMAHADRDERAAREPSCARCHTTHGFLATLGGLSREPPPKAEAIGIACAACHAPHAADAGPRLVRTLPATGSREASFEPTTRLCAACHGGREPAGEALPAASAAIVWSGSDPAALAGARVPGPHATLGCVACHMPRGSDDSARGTSHRMVTTPATCAPCHAAPPREKNGVDGRSIAARASDLWRAIGRREGAAEPVEGGARPPHARGGGAALDPRLAAAARAVAIVLEDPAAYVHNAAFARALLDSAEAALASRPAR